MKRASRWGGWQWGVGAAVAAAFALAGCDGRPDPVEVGELAGAGDVRLHYEVYGTGPDTAVVVHGGPGAGIGSVLPDLAPLADQDLTLIFYDQRGGGRSTLPEDTALLDARWFVDDLEAVRRHFGLERMAIMAHSFGALIAARWAERYPERVDRIVLHSATPPVMPTPEDFARAASPSPDPRLSGRARELLRSLLAGDADDPVATCREYEDLSRRLAEARRDTPTWRGSTCAAPAEAVRYYYRYTARLTPRSFGKWDFRGKLDAMTAPVLVVHGALDEVGAPGQAAWAEAYPGGCLFEVTDAGEAAISDRPETVVPAVAAFLKGAPGAADCPS